MKRLYIGAVAAAVGFWACQGDPTASLRGGPFLITVQPDLMFISEGSDRVVNVTVSDEQLNPLPVTVTATSMNGSVFTVTSDTLPVTNNVRTRFFVSALAPGQATLAIAGGGLTKNATVNVLPRFFTGAASSGTPQVGQPFSLSATALLEFGGSTNIDFGDGVHGIVTAQTATNLTVIVPQPDATQPAALRVEDVVVNYVTGLKATLPTATTYNVQNPYSDSDAPDPVDPDANFTLTSPGAPIVFYDGYKSGGVDRFYTLNLAGTVTFTVELEWDTSADIDILYCDVGCNSFVGNFDGATGANPEISTVTLGAGSYNLWLNVFDEDDAPSHLFKVTLTPQ